VRDLSRASFFKQNKKMALDLKLLYDSINDLGTKITLIDNTGAYSASNLTGFGTPNPDRDTLALIVRAYSKRYDGGEEIVDTLLTVTPDDADPVVAASWELTLNGQGWQQATVYGLQLYDVSLSFEVGELVYDTGSSAIRKILTKSGDGPYTYTYEVVEESALDDLTLIKAYYKVYNTYAIPGLCECKYRMNKEYFDARIKDPILFKKYLELTGILEGINSDFGFGSYSEAQSSVEYAEDICTCFTDECSC
jgi:hypothetical protein